MNKGTLITSIIGLAFLASAPIQLARAAETKPKYSVEEIMKALNKGQQNIGKRAASGQASKEDLTALVDYYDALPLNPPPKGDKASWTEKTAAVAKAARALKAGESGAAEAFKAASNCKACHSIHKPD